MKFFLIPFAFFFISCTQNTVEPRDWKQIKDSGVLRVATIYGPTTYHLNKDEEPHGFEYEMAKAFAKNKKLKVKFIKEKSIEDVFEKLLSGRADIAAAGLTVTPERSASFSFSSPYQTVQQQVVCRKGVNPKNMTQLSEYITHVEKASSYAERLRELAQTFSSEHWKEVDKNTQALFSELNSLKPSFDCTVADSHRVALRVRLMPQLNIAFDLGGEDSLGWAFHSSAEELRSLASIWIESAQKQGMIANWQDKYYSKTDDFDPYDLKVFMKRLNTRLPKYRNLFKQYAKEHDFDWHLLAAVSYQESHWDPNAKSPTGVEGLMMLTNKTAKAMGVKNRKDPEQSIMGGAKYLRELISQVSPYIDEDDRIWVALASYNVGAAHVRDARSVAVWNGYNPNEWTGIKRSLPKLENKKVYWRLPHGYARGLEPVIYVRRIRHYLALLNKHQ